MGDTTVIGLGLAALGRPGYLNVGHGDDLGSDHSVRALRERSFALLDAAHSAGVRWFDAARSYGRAEEFLGAWLRDRAIAPGAVTISSKWGYRYTAGWEIDADPPEVKELTLAQFRRQAAETRRLLGAHLSLYQIHSATLESGVLDDRAVLRALAAMREQGVRIGLSTSGPEQGETIERAVHSGAFDSVQATWNLLERSAGDALERAHAAGLTVIVKEALANGRLSARGDVAALADAAARVGAAPDALALASVLARPWADVVLSGAATVEHLHANLGARDVAFDEALDAELAGLEEAPDHYWELRAELAWT